MEVKNFVKHLGVRLGNIRQHQDEQGWGLTIEQAFAPALQEAFRLARVVSKLHLSMDERAFMLTSSILPAVAWVSKAYYDPIPVIRQPELVYHVTMGTNSWGVTLPILSRPRLQGGLALPEPELFLMHQAATPFVSLLGEPTNILASRWRPSMHGQDQLGLNHPKTTSHTSSWAWLEQRD